MFTCDLNTAGLPLNEILPPKTKKEEKLSRANARLARDRYRLMCFTNQLQASMKFELDSDLVHMRSGFAHVSLTTLEPNQGFYELFG